MINRYKLSVACVVVIATLAGALYLPFLNNALVFDDHNIFTNLAVYDYAQKPFDLHPRTFPYFTLGWTQVILKNIEAHRVISLSLHVLCAWMLFVLLAALLRQALSSPEQNYSTERKIANQTTVLAFIGASWFAIHPIAVYGAGYLAQRTILFSTFFSLLSLWFYRRAFSENRTMDIVTAALFYSAAVFSKEHALMLPITAISLTALYNKSFLSNIKRISLYLCLCTPAAILVILNTLNTQNVVGASYEPYVGALTPQIHGIPLLNKSWGPWFVSASIQMGAFFNYFYYWIIPDLHFLSADIRIDFEKIWASRWLIPKMALFLVCPGIALYCLRRSGRLALFGCGLLYCWMLFICELSTVRFQEPFVLYRSYLWAPGFIMMLLAPLSKIRWQGVLIVFLVVAPLFFFLANDRLKSLLNERTVWEDAAAKLHPSDVPGADRIYYNLGGEQFKRGEWSAALINLNRVIALNPNAFQGYLGLGKIYLQLGKNQEALFEFDQALSHQPPKKGFYGYIQFHRGTALQALGRQQEAFQAFQYSADDGYPLARLVVQHLDKNQKN